jgi:hypothetical protein
MVVFKIESNFMLNYSVMQMFGPGVTMELLTETIKTVKPRSITMGSHTYVQVLTLTKII